MPEPVTPPDDTWNQYDTAEPSGSVTGATDNVGVEVATTASSAGDAVACDAPGGGEFHVMYSVGTRVGSPPFAISAA